jgi:hypothetical protein
MAGEGNRGSNEVVRQWHRSAQRVESLKSQLRSAECDLRNATNKAGKHLCPPDAEVGESFQMWIRTDDTGFVEKERIVIATRMNDLDYKLEWRSKKPKPVEVKAA